MSCDCNALSNQLNQINGKIDNLIRENNQLKAQLKGVETGLKGKVSLSDMQSKVKESLGNIPSSYWKGLLVAGVGLATRADVGASLAKQASKISSLERLFKGVETISANFKGLFSRVNNVEKGLKVSTNLGTKAIVDANKAIAQSAKASVESRAAFQKLANGVNDVRYRLRDSYIYTDNKYKQLLRSNQALSKTVNSLQGGYKFVSAGLAKLAPLLALVSLVASIISLVLVIGSIKALGGRMNALEKAIDSQANALSKIYSIITPIKFKVDNLANISPNLQFEFDRLVKTVNGINKDLSIVSSNLKNTAFMTKSAVNALIGSAIASATSVIIGSAVGAIISRFPRITRIPTSGTNTVTNNTRIIERQTINNTIIQPTKTIERNTFREIRTNTITNNNSSNSSGANIDYGRIQSIVSSEGNSVRNTVRSEHQVTRGLLGGIRQSVAATRTRLNNVAPPILKTDISQAVQQATKPIFDSVSDIRKKTASIYQNQFIQSAMSTLNTAILVHNAMRLSFDAGQFITDSLGAVLNLTGIKFRDENQNEISLSQAVGGSIQGAINQIIPASMQSRISDVWIRSSSIFSSAANVLWAVRNIGDELQNVTEITNDRLGLWMNTARDERLVSLDAYPHQPPISTGSPYGRYNSFLAKVNSKTESWENTVNNVEDAAGSVGYIASVPISVGSELQQIGENRTNIVNAVAPVQDQKQVELDEQLIDNEAPETLDSPIPYSDSVE